MESPRCGMLLRSLKPVTPHRTQLTYLPAARVGLKALSTSPRSFTLCSQLQNTWQRPPQIFQVRTYNTAGTTTARHCASAGLSQAILNPSDAQSPQAGLHALRANFWTRPDNVLGKSQQWIDSIRETYKHSLWPRELVSDLRSLSKSIDYCQQNPDENVIPDNRRDDIARIKEDAMIVFRSAKELADQIEKWDTWLKTVWRWTGGRISWGATIAINGLIAMVTS